MAIIENTNDLILTIGAIAAAIGGIIAGIRASRCQYVNFCKGCFIVRRDVKENKPEENPMTLTPPALTPNNSEVSLNTINV